MILRANEPSRFLMRSTKWSRWSFLRGTVIRQRPKGGRRRPDYLPKPAAGPALPRATHGGVSVSRRGLARGAGQQMLQNVGHFSRLEAVRASFAFVSYVSIAVQNVEAIRPGGVSDLG